MDKMRFVTNLLTIVLFLLATNVHTVLTQSENQTEILFERILDTYCSTLYKCSDNCDSEGSSSCSCHPACELFGDCCYNTLENARKCFTSNITEPFTSVTLPEVKQFFRCTTDVISEKKYWMISSCPNSWKGSNECDVTESDLFVGKLEDNLSGVPVLSNNGLTYRNIYCALCHGENIPALTPWEFDAKDCEVNRIFGNAANLSTKDLILLLRENCNSVSFLPPTDHRYYSLSVIPCHKVTDDVIDKCDEVTNNTDIQLRCSNVAAPILIGNNYFKNVFCIECFYSSMSNIDYDIVNICESQISSTHEMASSPSTTPGDNNLDIYRTTCRYCYPLPDIALKPLPLVPISITFDFGMHSGSVSVRTGTTLVSETFVTCDNGQVFDPIESNCKQLSCPVGFVLQDLTCVPSPDNNTRFNSLPCTLFEIKIKFYGEKFGNNSCPDDIESIFSCLPVELIVLLNPSEKHHDVYCRLTSNGELLFKINSSSLNNIEKLLSNFSDRSSVNSHTCRSLNKIEVSADCSSTFDDRLIQCRAETKWSEDSDTISDMILFQKNSSEPVKTFPLNIRHLLEYSNATGKISRSEDIYVTWCEFDASNTSTCPLVTLDPSLFTPSKNDPGVLVFLSNHSLQFTPDMYTKLPNGSIQVCNSLSVNGSVTTHFRFLPRYSSVQAIMSTVGILLSLISLSVTLISYCIFPTLRTRPENIVIMILCCCLAIAQVLLLLSGIATFNPIVCSTVSGLGHFFWLAAFSSTSVLGFRLNRTVTARKQRSGKPSVTTICVIILQCIMFPVLISGTLMFLYYIDEDGRYGIVYGSTSGCWIGGKAINLYAFGIPVAVCLFTNAILFVLISFSICINTVRSKRMRKTKIQIREITIYFKIFIILGLTWISGFVAVLLDQPWLWYAFIVLTSLQGVFIFLAFTVKSQILKLWKKRLWLGKLPDRSSSSQSEIPSGRRTERLNMSWYNT